MKYHPKSRMRDTPVRFCERGDRVTGHPYSTATKLSGLFRENPLGGGSFGRGPRWLGRHSPLRGCSGLAALATAKIPCRRTPRNFQTGSKLRQPRARGRKLGSDLPDTPASDQVSTGAKLASLVGSSPKAPIDVAPGKRIGGKPKFYMLPPRARGGACLVSAEPAGTPEEGLHLFIRRRFRAQ